MARLVGPDEASRLVYLTSGRNKGKALAQGMPVVVYADAGASTLTDIQTVGGDAIVGSTLLVDTYSKIPLFRFPDGVDTVYAVASGGPVVPLYARTDDRLDALESNLAVIGATYLARVAAPTGIAAADTAAIQAALDEGGRIILSPGQYELTAGGLTMRSGVTLDGAGENTTILHQAAASGTAIAGVDLEHVAIRNLRILGPGPWTGTGFGIDFSLSGTAGNATFYVEMRNVRVEEFGVDGVRISTPIVSIFERVVPFKNGRHGIHLFGAGEAAGTSCTFTSCFPAGNKGAGIRLKQMAYTTLNGCAGDANGIAYEYDTCVGVTENSSGSEEPYDFSADQPGYSGFSRKIFNSKMTLNSPYMIGNIFTALWVTNVSVVTINGLFEGSPGNIDSLVNTPTNSVLVDAGCKVALNNPIYTTALNLASGTTTVMPDALSSLDSSDPGGGQGVWMLGTYLTDTVALDTAHYIEVNIDGVVRKLLVAS